MSRSTVLTRIQPGQDPPVLLPGKTKFFQIFINARIVSLSFLVEVFHHVICLIIQANFVKLFTQAHLQPKQHCFFTSQPNPVVNCQSQGIILIMNVNCQIGENMKLENPSISSRY